ncbi:MAG: adenylate kinase [Acidobacteria bacterium]|nr:MAG: adenylate kinase [Acidobacteriota bacterium]
MPSPAGTARRLALFGAPGVGKGVQAAALRERLGVPHVSTGDMLRAAVKDGSPLGRKVRAILERGGLVPDEVVGDLIRERLGRPDAGDGFVLDGFPRTVPQADLLDRVLAGRGRALDRAINIVVPEPEILDRLTGRRVCPECGATYHVRHNPPRVEGRCDACGGALRQREDDTEPVIAERLRVYQEQTSPLIERYQRRGVLLTVDGRGRPEEVTARIVAALPGQGG